MASSFLKEQANKRAKRIQKAFGKGVYGSTPYIDRVTEYEQDRREREQQRRNEASAQEAVDIARYFGGVLDERKSIEKDYDRQREQLLQFGPYGDERDRAGSLGANALTQEMEAEFQRRNGRGNRLTPFQEYMRATVASMPEQEETRSTDELRRDMNRQNRLARATNRMAADMGGQMLRDQSGIYDPVRSTNLGVMARTMETQQEKADRATELYRTESTRRRWQEEQEKYASLLSNPDFAAKSGADETIGRNLTAASPAERLYRTITKRSDDKSNAKDRQAAEFVTDEEASIFYYLWNTQGARAAKAYYDDYVHNRASERRAVEAQRQAYEFGRNDMLGSSAESVVGNFASGVGLLDMAWQNLARSIGITDPNKPLNYYSAAQLPSLVSDSIRSGVADQLAEYFPKLSIGKAENATNVVSFLYQTGMSMADSGVSILLNMVGIPEAATLANMGAIAGTRAIRDAKERGATDGQALAFGISSSIMEGLFEKISLDKILEPSTATKFWPRVKNAIDQMFTEGSEEVMTTLANTAFDQLIMGDKSELFTRQRRLMEQGVSEKEALRAAMLQWGTEVLGDLLGGMISGLGMGGTKEIATGLRYAARDAQTAREMTDVQNREAAQAREQALRTAYEQAQNRETAEPVQPGQQTPREQNPLQYALDKAANGETLTKNDARAILEDEQAMQTLRDAGVLAENVRNDSEGRGQVLQAVEALAEQNRAETMQAPAENVQETPERAEEAAPAQERTGPPLPSGVQQNTETGTAAEPAQAGPPLPSRMTQEQGARAETPAAQESAQGASEGLRLPSRAEAAEPKPTPRANLTIGGRNVTLNENRQEADNGRKAEAADAERFRAEARKNAAGWQADGGGQWSTGVARLLDDVRNYRTVRDLRGRADQAASLQNQADARNLRYVSGKELGVEGASDAATARILDNDMLGREWEQTVKEYAAKGVTLRAMTGQIETTDLRANGLPVTVRAWVSGDGKNIIVQADHPTLSWQQLLAHEELHRRIKGDDAYRRSVQDALLEDEKLKPYLSRILDRYTEAYRAVKPGITDAEIVEELLADYRAGFDMLDPLGLQDRNTAKAAKAAARDIREVERKAEKSVENQATEPTETRQYETNGGKPAPAGIEENFAEAKNSVEPPYRIGTKAADAFEAGLNEKAREIYDMFLAVRNASLENTAVMTVGSGKKAHPKRVTIADRFLTAADWNEQVKNDPEFAQAAQNIFAVIPENIRKNARLNDDGTISETEFEKRFKMARSLVQRLVDALPKGVVDSTVELDGKDLRVARGRVTASVGGEEYRRAMVAEKRRLYEEGSLPTRAISTLSHDNWGAMGFLATNTKTIASGDFTTFCPQMYFNDGCWYCYRRAALTSGVNNKLTAETVWYAGEILQLRQADIDRLNQVGGLRIQSFGDWMTQYSTMLADMLIDAEKVGLQIKIITKEPSMIDTVALLKEQGLGKSLYFNLSADYTIEKRGKVDNTNTSDALPMNPERPFMQRENESGEEETWWKRALTVQEANEYRKMYPWVNTRIVATNLDEFIRGLSDPTVDVVTGYHGDIRQYERVSSETGETLLDVEPLGDAGMPRFAYDRKTGEWTLEYEGKSRYQKQLAQRIQEEGLEREYYTKSCCIFGRCAKCQGKCGSYARSFAVKNATNRDQESVKYWQREMESGVDNPLLESQQEGKASTEIDTDYMNAVESGDMETAQKMVDEAAKAAGYTTKGYHGTSAKFNVFSKKKQGDNWGGDSRLGPGFYFAHDRKTADKWSDGTRIIEAWLSIKKPLDLRKAAPSDIVEQIKKRTENKLQEYDSSYPISRETYESNLKRMEEILLKDPALFIDEFKYDSNGKMTDGIREFLSGLGYDGIISNDEIVVFEPEQIKSADPVTYDDNGNIIPLSQRFNTKNEDTRFSREIRPEVVDRLDKQIKDGNYVIVYHSLYQDKDGNLYSPMAGKKKVGDKWVMTNPYDLNAWYKSDAPENIADLIENGTVKLKDSGGWSFLLKKPDAGGTDVPAALNPWNHASTDALNDQFNAAFARETDEGELVTVESIIPLSEVDPSVAVDPETGKVETKPYEELGMVTDRDVVAKPDSQNKKLKVPTNIPAGTIIKPKDSVGLKMWKAGPVHGQISGKRPVYLSRWIRNTRVLSTEETAKMIAKTLKDENFSGTIPGNVVGLKLRQALENEGVKFGTPTNKGYYAYMAERGYTKSQAEGEPLSGSTSIEIDPEVAAQFSPEAIALRQAKRNKGVKGERKVSRVRSNTYEYSGLYNEVEAQMDEADEQNFTYDPISEKKSMNEALGRLRKDFDGEVSRLSEADRQWGGSDLDTAMGILHRYRTEGRETGDYSRFWDWSKTIQEHGTKGGQFIQAFAKYTRTGTGAAMKGAKDIHDRFKLNPAQQKQVDAAKKKLMDGIDSDMNGAASDAMKQAKGQKEPGKKQDGKVDKKKLDAEVQRRKDAERLVREISKLFEKQQNHGEPVENWLNLTGEELARKIAGRFSEPKQRAKTTMQTILSDLVGFAEEHALPDRKKAEGTKRTAIDIITDYLNNRDAYGTAWAAAQSYLRAAYTDDQEKLDALNSFLTATIAYNAEGTDRTMLDAILQSADVLGISEKRILELTSAGATASTIDRIGDELVKQVKERMGADYDESFTQQLKDAVRRHITGIALQESAEEQRLRLGKMTTDAARQLDLNLQKLLTESRGDKNRATQSVADYLIRELDIPSIDAAIAAQRISEAFMDELASRADRRLQQMFAEKKPKTQEQRDKLLDLIRLGGLTNSNVEDAVVDALGIGGMSRERQRELVADMARFGETLDAMEDDDAEGLRQLIREQAAARGTKLSRLSEKTLSGETDIEYLRDFALAQLASIAGDFENRSAGEMISTYQTISHLLNMRTALRNVTSNQVFDLIDSAANNVSMLPDMVLGLMTGKRTVGLNKSWASQQKRQGAIQGAKRNALEVNLDVGVDDRQKSKYGTAGRRTWNMANSRTVGKILSHLEEAMGYELNTTDEFHKGSVMGETLESLARFVDRGDMTLEEAQEFATEMALYRSFQDDSMIGTMLSAIKEALNIAGVGEQNGKKVKGKKVHDFGLGDFLTKYTQVPGALVHRAIEFSPLGYAKAIYNLGQLANQNRKGENTNAAQRKAALAIGRATTGSGLIALFAALAAKGLLRRDDKEDKNAKAAHQAQGLSGTQLNLTALGRWIGGESTEPQDGDILMDINFLEPLDALMALGTMVAESEDLSLNSIKDMSVNAIWESISSLSMMQTLRDVAQVRQYYNEDDKDQRPLPNQIAWEIAASSVSGFIPSVVRQLAQATDTTYREQYGSKDVNEQILAKVKNSIPGLRQTLPPKITPLGEEKRYEKPLLNYLNATLNPGNVSVYKSSDVVDELNRVYNETNDKKIWPERNAPYTISYGDEKYTLTTEERTQFQRDRGQLTAQMMEETKESEWYQKMDAEAQADILNWIGNFANAVATAGFVEGRGMDYYSSTYSDQIAELRNGAPLADIVKSKNSKAVEYADIGLSSKEVEDLKKQYNAIGNQSISSYEKGVKQRALINGLDYSDDDKLRIYASLANADSRIEKFRTVMDKGLSFSEIVNVYDKYSELDNQEGLKASDKAKDFALWVDKQKYTDEQKETIKDQFNYWQMMSANTDRYDKLKDLGLDPDTASAIDKAIGALEPLPGKESVSNSQKWNAALKALGTNASKQKKLDVASMFFDTSMTTDSGKPSQWAKIKRVADSGVSVEDTLKMVENEKLDVYVKWMDSDAKTAGVKSDTYISWREKYNSTSSTRDENGKEVKGQTKKDKILAYIDSLNLTAEQKDALFLEEYKESGLKDTPWHSSGGGKSGGDKARIQLPTQKQPWEMRSKLTLPSRASVRGQRTQSRLTLPSRYSK